MIEYILFVIGIFLLIKGADYLVSGSSSLAKRLGIPSLVIGLTVVAFGTSMPELVVNVIAAINGSGDIAFGNIIGSNISNILLILGITAIIIPLSFQKSTFYKEIPFSLLAILMVLIFVSTQFLDGFNLTKIFRFEGLILIGFFAIFLYYVASLSKKKNSEFSEEKIKDRSLFLTITMILGGLVALYFGGKWVVNGAVALATLFGLSEYFISLTIVAVGTSLPELVTSIVAALKKNADIAVGNIIGSNIFNIFWVLGLSAVITPITIPQNAIFDVLVLLITTVVLAFFVFVDKRYKLTRWEGITMVLMYIAYVIFLIVR